MASEIEQLVKCEILACLRKMQWCSRDNKGLNLVLVEVEKRLRKVVAGNVRQRKIKRPVINLSQTSFTMSCTGGIKSRSDRWEEVEKFSSGPTA
jgi:hypothetical protein